MSHVINATLHKMRSCVYVACISHKIMSSHIPISLVNIIIKLLPYRYKYAETALTCIFIVLHKLCAQGRDYQYNIVMTYSA